MDKKIKARWVKALRSGKYRQGRRSLRSKEGDRFCCLGVLCDLHRKEVGGKWIKDDYRAGKRRGAMEGGGTLPTAVSKWAGLGKDDNPSIKIRGHVQAAACHNDAGCRFSTIAKAIEAQL